MNISQLLFEQLINSSDKRDTLKNNTFISVLPHNYQLTDKFIIIQIKNNTLFLTLESSFLHGSPTLASLYNSQVNKSNLFDISNIDFDINPALFKYILDCWCNNDPKIILGIEKIFLLKKLCDFLQYTPKTLSMIGGCYNSIKDFTKVDLAGHMKKSDIISQYLLTNPDDVQLKYLHSICPNISNYNLDQDVKIPILNVNGKKYYMTFSDIDPWHYSYTRDLTNGNFLILIINQFLEHMLSLHIYPYTDLINTFSGSCIEHYGNLYLNSSSFYLNKSPITIPLRPLHSSSSSFNSFTLDNIISNILISHLFS